MSGAAPCGLGYRVNVSPAYAGAYRALGKARTKDSSKGYATTFLQHLDAAYPPACAASPAARPTAGDPGTAGGPTGCHAGAGG